MKKELLLGASLLLLPLASSAAVYHYVDTSGTVQSVSANTAAEALGSAVNIAPHSGVTLDRGLLDAGDHVPVNTAGAVGTTGQYAWHYVDVNGTVQTVHAATASAALALAVNIAPHSGVTLDTGDLQAGEHVPVNVFQ